MAEIPGLVASYPVTDAQVENLRNTGHVKLPGVFSLDETAAYFPLLREYLNRWAQTNAVHQNVSAGGHGAELWTLANAPPSITEFVTAPRLGEIVSRLLDVDAVRILFFNSFFKPPKSGGTLLHQDMIYIPLDTDNAVTVWIPLVDVPLEMGALVFAEGSHRHGLLKPVDAKRFRVVKNENMRAGDVSVHMAWTIHGSLKNVTDAVREAVGICFYADGARIAVPGSRPFDEIFMEHFFTGLGPGDVAAGPITPVVFRRSR